MMLLRSSSAPQPQRSVRPCLEALEDRSLPSVTPLPQLLLTTRSGEVQTVQLGEGESIERALASYRADSRFATAEVDQRVGLSAIPNDPSFGTQWALRNTGQSGGTADADIDAAEAWDKTTGSMKIAVGVIDTGVDYRHPDLYLNIWLNPGEIPPGLGVIDTDGDQRITFRDLNHSANSTKVSEKNFNNYIDAGDLLKDPRWANGADNDGNGYTDDLIGWDFVNNDNDPFDDNNHGTHVAGTIGAIGNNWRGVVGVNLKVAIAPLKFLDNTGNGDISDAVLALNYAVAKNIQITNNSWVGGGSSLALGNAIDAARLAGDIYVAAAGNDASNNDNDPTYPANYTANYTNVLSVAATDRNDNLAGFSNYGARAVDIAAPGVGILSTTPHNGHAIMSGTSMATPHVAGAAALVWSQDAALSSATVISRLLNNVDRPTSLTGKVATGRLNVNQALVAPVVDSTGPRVVSSVPNGGTSVSSVRVTFSEPIDVASFTTADIRNFSGPVGSTLAITSIAQVGTTGTTFDVKFSTLTIAGIYRFDIGPDVLDKSGNKMNQNGNTILGESTDTFRASFAVSPSTQTFTNTTRVPINDRAWSISAITITQDINIQDLTVKLNLSHSYDSDLLIMLRGPMGTDVVLSAYRGGAGDGFTNTVFSDAATTPISSGQAPFTGTYRPEQLLSAYDGKIARGTWVLYVYDANGGDVGAINSWSMTVRGTIASVKPKSVLATAIVPGVDGRAAGAGSFVAAAG